MQDISWRHNYFIFNFSLRIEKVGEEEEEEELQILNISETKRAFEV